MIKILELFGGIGSPRIALRNLGIDVKAIDYVEIDEKAVRSYNAMFQKDLKYKTQSVVDYNLKPDILIHGSPCQDFSIAGKQKGADEGSETRSSLMWETLNIIEQMREWKPRIVIWENVKGVLTKSMNANFNKYLTKMELLGYTNSFEILNAMDFGLPQKRERVFTISYLDGTLFNFNLLEKKVAPNIAGYLEKDVSSRYILHQPSMLGKLAGTENGSFTNRLKLIDDYCYTITTKQMRCPNAGIVNMGNNQYRILTEKECWLLQGYSQEDYEAAKKVNPRKKDCLNGALYKQAGNSIPVPIFESIFKQILNVG